MPEPSTRTRGLLDQVGAAGSFLCALHCALLPLLFGVLPGIGLASLIGREFEVGFVLFATALGAISLGRGYRRHHDTRALVLLLPGLVGLWLGAFYEPLHASTIPHAIMMTLGGTLVALSHLANLRLSRVTAVDEPR